MSTSRSGDGSRGLYTTIFDDDHAHSMLAYFSPNGKACCYYRNGGIHLLSDAEGGTLFDEVCDRETLNRVPLAVRRCTNPNILCFLQGGAVIRKWVWPPSGLKLPVSVSIQVGISIQLPCTRSIPSYTCQGVFDTLPSPLSAQCPPVIPV